MVSIKTLSPSPSHALTAMCDGLERTDEQDGFMIKMNHLVCFDDDTCYGCAATAALQQITGKDWIDRGPMQRAYTKDCRAEYYLLDANKGRKSETAMESVSNFEGAIDDARCGIFGPLFNFYGYYDYDDDNKYDKENLAMTTKNWRKKIPMFRKVIERMQKDHPEWAQL